ncbi:MAG: hypothetical protein HRU00_01935 [Myxococcales bacterium]|nr:hypothetical protein [Myxococcales bacterium]
MEARILASRLCLGTRGLFVSVSVMLCFGLAGCDRRVDPYVPREDEPPSRGDFRIPGLARPAPRLAEGMPGRGRELAADATVSQAEPIRGTLELADAATPSGSAVLFVIARSPAGGPPLAVKRLGTGAFPIDFEIGPADAMLAGRPFAGPVQLSARLDADGDPLTRQPEDLVAALPDPVEPGTDGLRLVLEPPGP